MQGGCAKKWRVIGSRVEVVEVTVKKEENWNREQEDS